MAIGLPIPKQQYSLQAIMWPEASGADAREPENCRRIADGAGSPKWPYTRKCCRDALPGVGADLQSRVHTKGTALAEARPTTACPGCSRRRSGHDCDRFEDGVIARQQWLILKQQTLASWCNG